MNGKRNLKAIDGEKTTKDALLESGSKHNNVVFFIHGGDSSYEKLRIKRNPGKVEIDLQ